MSQKSRLQLGGGKKVRAIFSRMSQLYSFCCKPLRMRCEPEIDPKGVDGKISRPPAVSATLNAIEAFQNRFTGAVDGVIAPGGQTWEALVGASGRKSRIAPKILQAVLNGSSLLLRFQPKAGKNLPLAFASSRAGGARLHAGCDLYFPGTLRSTPSLTVLLFADPIHFTAKLLPLEFDHGPILARYGEIGRSKTDVTAGDTVRAGQKIARVGHLVGIRVPSDMLHFELYDKTASGPLTVARGSGSAVKNGVPFMRRKDLIDPTLKLNQWRENLPPA